MAKLGVIANLHAFHMKVPIKFKIEAVIEGKISRDGWVEGISAIDFKRDLEALVRKLEYTGISGELRRAGIEFKGMESLGMYVIKKLSEKYPLKEVKVWEGEDEYAIIYADEI